MAFLGQMGNHIYTHELVSDSDKKVGRQFKALSGEHISEQQSWTSSPDESLYGGGQFVNGYLD